MELNLDVIHNGQRICSLNPTMVKKQGLNQTDVDAIKALHVVRYEKVELMKTLEPTNRKALHMLRDQIKELDFKLQEAWKFEKNENFHYFFNLPHCSCPKIDNTEAIGTPYKIIDRDCPVHG